MFDFDSTHSGDLSAIGLIWSFKSVLKHHQLHWASCLTRKVLPEGESLNGVAHVEDMILPVELQQLLREFQPVKSDQATEVDKPAANIRLSMRAIRSWTCMLPC